MQGKNERRFWLLDAAIILLAIFAILGVWQRDNLKDLFEKEEILEEYVLTFEIKRVRSTTAQLLQKDVAFYTEAQDEIISLGALTQTVAVMPATVHLLHPDPEVGTVEAAYPLDQYEYLQDGSGILACKGIEHDGSFFVDGKLLLSKGQQIAAKTELADVIIIVTDYRKVG